MTVDDLVDGRFDYHVVVNDKGLEEHIDLLKRLSDVKLIPVEQGAPLNARLYYVFKNEKGNEIFSVAMWGWDENANMFVNGNEVKGDKIFYEVILPFLPEDVRQIFQSIMNDT